MANETNVGVIQALKDASAEFDQARADLAVAENALAAAKAVYSGTCEKIAGLIPGDNKSLNRTIDGVKCKLTFAKSGRGNTWSCRGLPGREQNAEETLDLDA